jgi:predicted metal-dependent peptidase
MKQLLDEHLDPDDDGEDGEGGNSPSKSGNKEGEGSGRPSKMTAEEKKALRDEIREAVLHAAEAAGAGNLPAGVKRMINTLTNPQMNWRELIRQQIQSLVKSDYTWMKPSHRSWHMDAVFPGTNFAETIDVCVSIDASGSMSDAMLRDILSEVKGIMQAFDDFKLRVWSFDTDVYGMETFTPDNIDDIDYYEVQGGGGTTFEANWEFMKANEIIPKFFVMFTDGYPGNGWGDEDYCETLFVIHGTTNITAPFGQTAYYELSKEHA